MSLLLLNFERKIKNHDGFNPQDINYEELINDVQRLQNGEAVLTPIIERSTHKRIGHRLIEPTQIIIIEGTHSFDDKIVQRADIVCLVDADLHTRLMRRCLRNVREYGKDLEIQL